MTASEAIRIYGSLRTAHLERFREMTPATVLYRRKRYDYDESVLGSSPPPRRRSAFATVGHLLTHTYRYAELNEPFVSARWVDVAAQVLAIRVRDTVRRSHTRISAYCIGYSDPALEIHDRRPWLPVSVARAVTWCAVNVLVRGTDRLAFGTTGSFDMYGSYVTTGALASRSQLFEALPSPCECPPAEREDRWCLFVGSFQERKGIRQLMAAWDEVRSSDPDLRLHLIGKGPLVSDVQAWATERPEVQVDIDPPRAFIHSSLRRAGVLILLSQRSGAWREQIGLPIVEGLAHGATVVTTTETGLASWLAGHGHEVVDHRADARTIADAVRRAVGSARPAADVVADLPVVDQRAAADTWMLSGP